MKISEIKMLFVGTNGKVEQFATFMDPNHYFSVSQNGCILNYSSNMEVFSLSVEINTKYVFYTKIPKK